eukprot:symbB.v1.2.036326.t1/scaffold5103.1/size30861/2
MRWPRQLSSDNPESPSPRLHRGDVPVELQPERSNSGLRQDQGLISNSILSLSWSFGTEQCRQPPSTKSLSDGQTQTEISWSSIGWRCRNCQKPPRPPGDTQQTSEEIIRQKLQRIQGCWLLKAGPKQCVGWLQGFVVRGIEVNTTSGLLGLDIDEEGHILLAGGEVYVDQDDVLHRAGKSGGSYLYARVAEQHFAVQQMQPGGSPGILRPQARSPSWHSILSS